MLGVGQSTVDRDLDTDPNGSPDADNLPNDAARSDDTDPNGSNAALHSGIETPEEKQARIDRVNRFVMIELWYQA